MIEFNLFDYFIIIILLLSIITGLKQGFIKAITSLMSIIIAIILSFLLYDEILFYLNYYFNIGDYLTQIIYQKWSTPSFFVETSLFKYAFPLEGYFLDIREKLIDASLVIISFFAVFLLSMIFLKLISHFLARFFSWGILSWFNRLLGMVFITLKNLIIFLLILYFVTPVIELLSQIGLDYAIIAYNLINNSVIANYLLNFITTTIA